MIMRTHLYFVSHIETATPPRPKLARIRVNCQQKA